jgi:hypothetical protein
LMLRTAHHDVNGGPRIVVEEEAHGGDRLSFAP